MRTIISVLCLSLALSAGCKKDEPAKDEAKASEGAAAASQSGENENKTPAGEAGEKAKAPEANAAEKVATGDSAVKTVKPVATDKPATAPATAPAAAPAASSGLGKLPADVVGIAWIPGYDSLFDTIQKKSGDYGFPLPITKAAALQQVQGALQLKNMDWFDGSRALKVIAWSPKKAQDDNGLILIPIKSVDALKAALPDSKEENVEGNALAISVMGEKAFLNPIDGYAVLTSRPDMFGMAKDFAVKVGGSYKGKGLLQLDIAAGNLRTMFEAEIGALRGQIASLKPMLSKELEKEMPFPGMGGMDQIIDFYIDMMNIVIDESESFQIGVALDGKGNLSLPMSVTARAGGKIAGLANNMLAADLGFAKGAPANSWVTFGGHMDPKSFDGLMKYSADMAGGMLKLSDEEKAKLGSQLEQLMKLQDGKSWVSCYADGRFPMAMAMAAGTSDGAKYKALFDDYMKLVMGKVLGMAKEMMPPQLQGLPTDDFGKLVAAVNTITATAGVKLTTASTNDGLAVDSLTVEVDLDTLGKVAGPEAATKGKEITDLLGTRLELAMAYGPRAIGMAIGPNAVKAATDIAKGTAAAGGGALVSRYAPGTAAFMHIDIAAAMKAWMPIIKMAGEDVSSIPTFPPGTSIGFTMGAAKNTLTMEMYGSLDEFVKVGKMFAMRDAMGIQPAPIAVPAAPVAVPAAPPTHAPAAVPVEKKAGIGAGAGAAVVPAK